MTLVTEKNNKISHIIDQLQIIHTQETLLSTE